MIIKTKIFKTGDSGYAGLPELARAMGIPVSQIHHVREGSQQIEEEFIIAAIRAFPSRNLDELFYLTPELPCRFSAQPRHPGWDRQQSSFLDTEYAAIARA